MKTYFISVAKEVNHLPGLHQMADVWSKANKTSHICGKLFIYESDVGEAEL